MTAEVVTVLIGSLVVTLRTDTPAGQQVARAVLEAMSDPQYRDRLGPRDR